VSKTLLKLIDRNVHVTLVKNRDGQP